MAPKPSRTVAAGTNRTPAPVPSDGSDGDVNEASLLGPGDAHSL